MHIRSQTLIYSRKCICAFFAKKKQQTNSVYWVFTPASKKMKRHTHKNEIVIVYDPFSTVPLKVGVGVTVLFDVCTLMLQMRRMKNK